METAINPRSECLRGAELAVNGDRDAQYGSPIENFARIADLFNAYLGIATIEAHDVGVLLNLVKCSRIRETPTKLDSWMDAAGYMACGWDCAKALIAVTA